MNAGAEGAAPTLDAAVDAEHPWLGLASFTEETRGYFHGREEEVAELARRVQRTLLTVLFGQSGLGKTSILRAGIVPRLRPEGFCPVYVRIDYSADAPPPSEQIKQAIFRATEATGTWTRTGVAVEGESLWEFLHHRDDILKDADGRTVIPLLIFDQFEEIFTLAQADDAGRQRARQFIEDLADLVENRLPAALEAKLDVDDTITERFDFGRADYRILIALREDYLAHLEGIKGVMPSITQNRMRLARMNGKQALAAVMKPGGKLVSQEVAEAIVRFVAGGSELPNAEVEPSLLSLICRELNNARIAQGRAEISADLLAGSHDTILAEFYERALADQPAGVRKVIEDELLTESGYRESLAEERLLRLFAAAGAAPDALATLVNRRLLRIEERLDVRRVELTHDVLCGVVRASRELRLEREALEEAERKLAAQRERERATRKALIRARQIAIGCAVLAIVAVIGGVFGWYSMQRARTAEASAQAARAEAEKLIVYLLDDFYRELEPVGRLDIVGDLSKRALDYYAALPAALRNADTERNRALALARYGFVLRYQGKAEAAEKALRESIDVLARLRQQGDASELAAIGHAMATGALARVLGDRARISEAMKAAEQSVAILEPLAQGSSPSVSLRRAQGAALNFLGFGQLRSGSEEESVRTLERSREAYRSIIDQEPGDQSASAGFAEATAWQAEALGNLGRTGESQQKSEEAIAVATRILDQRPGHMPALRARALLGSRLANDALAEGKVGKAIAGFEASTRDWRDLTKLDPGSTIAWNNLSADTSWLAWSHVLAGHPDAALKVLRESMDLDRRAGPGNSPMLAGALAFQAGWKAWLETDTGNARRAEADLAARQRLLGIESAAQAPDALDHQLNPGADARFIAMAANAARDFVKARDAAKSGVEIALRATTRNAGEERIRNTLVADCSAELTEALYNLGDYDGAEQAARERARYLALLPGESSEAKYFRAEAAVSLGLALARKGQADAARAAVEPALAFLRGRVAGGSENLHEHLLLARALLVVALSAPAQAQASLREAARLVDAFPPEMRQRRSVSLVRGWIAEAMKTRQP